MHLCIFFWLFVFLFIKSSHSTGNENNYYNNNVARVFVCIMCSCVFGGLYLLDDGTADAYVLLENVHIMVDEYSNKNSFLKINERGKFHLC